MLWLRVGTSNNDPHLIAHHYLKTVQDMSGIKKTLHIADLYTCMFLTGCPKIIRCDRGTENSVVAYLQPFLRRNCSDIFSGENSFRYGRSTSNQVSICSAYRDIVFISSILKSEDRGVVVYLS